MTVLYKIEVLWISVERGNEEEQTEEGNGFQMTEIKETEDEIHSGEGMNPTLIQFFILHVKSLLVNLI